MKLRRYDADVVVVGARCAGAATAMLLARMGHRVVAVDRVPRLRDTLSTHGIARGGVVQLSRWGLLDAVLASGAPAVRQASFCVDGADPVVRPIKHRAGVELLVAPRRHVLDSLLAQAASDAGADVRLGVTVTGVLRDGQGAVRGVTGRSSDGDPVEISARYVVGADGVRSTMAGHFGADVIASHPRHSALFYAYFRDIDAVGYEFHVGAPGLAGVFPTHGGEGCVWLCAPTAASAALLSAGADRTRVFVESIAGISGQLADRLRAGSVSSPVRGTAELPNHLRRAAGPGWALVGDAGLHRDPVTGHGITDAFRDAELLARALDGALRGRLPEPVALDAYQAARDSAARDVFALTCELAAYPPTAEFVALQKRLSDALEIEAELLAALPPAPPATHRPAPDEVAA